MVVSASTLHLRRVCLTYAQHWVLSTRLAILFALAALKAATHAFCPGVYASSSTDAVARATQLLASAGCPSD